MVFIEMIKKYLIIFCYSIFFLALTGCSSLSNFKTTFENWQSKLSERKTFQIRKAWVRSTPKNINLKFRKINRMSPLLFFDAKNERDIVIQANAIDGLVAYKQSTGREIWRLPIENGVEGSAAIINDRIFFGGNDGFFYSANAATGEVIWSFPTRIENLSEPLINNGNVYFLTGNNSLFALDASNGNQLWLYTRQDTNPLSVRGGSKPVIKGETIYAGFSDGYLVALSLKDGQLKWEKQLNKNKKFRDLDTNPLVEGDFIYALGFDDHLYCLRAASGEMVWTSEKGGYGGMLIQGDRLYYATTNSEFIAVDKTTGQSVWSYKLNEGIATSPNLFRGLVVFGESQGILVFLDSGTGKLVGSFDPGKGILSSPTIDVKHNFVYFISGEANIYALEAGFKYPNQISYLK